MSKAARFPARPASLLVHTDATPPATPPASTSLYPPNPPNPLPPSRRPKSLPSIHRDRHTVPWLLSSLMAEWTVATGPQAYDGAQPTAITSCQSEFFYSSFFQQNKLAWLTPIFRHTSSTGVLLAAGNLLVEEFGFL